MLRPFKKWCIVISSLFFVLLSLYFVLLEVFAAVAKSPMELPVHPIPLKVQTEQGIVSYDVEIAFTQSQAEFGLMYRTNFPHDRAMLFRQQGSQWSEDNKKLFMWMANVPLSLDMIFLNHQGVIVSIVEKTSPFSTDTISSTVPATFALEVNAGEVSKKQIQKGQRIFHPVICGTCEEDVK
ncbi:uncharacterized membrane protein (UPF0127 family) [Bartonella silvatica]|uniref:Uncharacterized membrane protein (UPF0127 family) n=1 Tax=Bartonella silvatica TaxID=357760 RepID=A0ABV2HI34_9HYPH